MLCLLHHLSRPPPVNGVLAPLACCIFFVLYTIPLRSKLAAKALLLSLAQPGVVISLKLAKTAPPGSERRARRHASAFCFQPAQRGAALISHALRQHGLGHLDEARHVGAYHQIALSPAGL